MDIDGVFEGGGIRGIALAGAAAAAMDAGYAFRRAAGTSAGAMVASLVAAGYEADELREAVCKADWPALLDPMPWTRIPGIGKHISLMLHHGMYRGKMLEERWGRLLAAKGVRTFGDLSPGSLKLVATDITHQSGVVLPEDLRQYGIDPMGFSVARAVHMSAAVPFVYVPVRLPHRNADGEVVLMSDGAMASRFPLEVLQPSEGRPIVGFRLSDDDATHEYAPIRGPIALAIAVIGSGMGARETLPRLALEPGRVVTVPAERDVLDFDITPQEARQFFDAGRVAAAEWFVTNNPETPSVPLSDVLKVDRYN
ncbi:MAG: patatin-like phospholipase family protein [Acidimicrobiia bacterium]